MAKKSYDQRLKERWRRKQKHDHEKLQRFLSVDSLKMHDAYAATAWIMPFLFGKRNR